MLSPREVLRPQQRPVSWTKQQGRSDGRPGKQHWSEEEEEEELILSPKEVYVMPVLGLAPTSTSDSSSSRTLRACSFVFAGAARPPLHSSSLQIWHPLCFLCLCWWWWWWAQR